MKPTEICLKCKSYRTDTYSVQAHCDLSYSEAVCNNFNSAWCFADEEFQYPANCPWILELALEADKC